MFIVRYHEIALKGGNRPFFESQLKRNLEKSLAFLGEGLGPIKVSNTRDHLEVFCSGEQRGEVGNCIRGTLGVANFSWVEEVPLPKDDPVKSFETVCEHGVKLVEEALGQEETECGQGGEGVPFRVLVNRKDKQFPFNSMQIAREISGRVLPRFKGENGHGRLKVDLSHPKVVLHVTWDYKKVFLYVNKEKGPGGLAVGSAGKVVALLSAGFDSPVASWMMMRRGAKVAFVHFHSYPAVGPESIENVEKIVKILNQYQLASVLYLIPLIEYQKEVVAKAPSSLFVLLYRRMMMRLAQRVMYREAAKALVTGESLSQVASQTLDNLNVVNVIAKKPVFRPLIGMNKDEIIQWAGRIGTAEVSAQPYDDCCSLYVSRSPALSAKLEEIEAAEALLDVAGFEEKLWAAREMRKFFVGPKPE